MAKLVSEPTRARETFRYHPSLVSGIRYNDSSVPVPSSELFTSADPVLTGLTQLGACKTNSARSLISVFDEGYQYIIAEATPTLPLTPRLAHKDRDEDLWLCGTAIPRQHGVCEYTLRLPDPESVSPDKSNPSDLPLALVSDLTADPRFSYKPYCRPGAPARFYAAVPIRTRRGIHIGVYCVMDTEPRDLSTWDDRSTRLLREISQAIMEHLESNRAKYAYRRHERMNRGLGSLMEGHSTMTSWQHGPDDPPSKSNWSDEGPLGDTHAEHGAYSQHRSGQELEAERQTFDLETPSTSTARRGSNGPGSREHPELRHQIASHSPWDGTVTKQPRDNRLVSPRHGSDGSLPEQSAHTIFSKATNILRESIEVDGVMFLDATVRSFGGRVGAEAHRDLKNVAEMQDPVSSSTSSDEAANNMSFGGAASETPCEVLGFSTSDGSSIHGTDWPEKQRVMPEKFLSALLRRYPQGKIFNFDEHGGLQSSDSSEDSSAHAPTSQTSPISGRGSSPTETSRALGDQPRRRKKPWARQHEGRLIQETFPCARSVAFVPVWNSKKERWFAGGFAYTHAPTRVFAAEAELSYLRAIGMLAMAETHRSETLASDRAKSDALSSLSHELRSPLHGVVLGVELLHDTELSVIQENVLHTLEACSRTLVDTIDHLLDYSKINSYKRQRKVQGSGAMGGRGMRPERSISIESGMKSLFSDVPVDALCEEVMESVFAGFNYQHGSMSRSSVQRIANATRASSGNAGPRHGTKPGGEVSILLDIDPTWSWTFRTQPGALRRIIMNLFGNSLKYTEKGTIRITLTQELYRKRAPQDPARLVKLTVADTGRGISEEYLRDELFKPFTQEDRLAPGTGLGLSLVKQITSQLKGSIYVESRVGAGTTVSVSLPLEHVPSPVSSIVASSGDDMDPALEEHVRELKGLRVRILGFGSGKPVVEGPETTHDKKSGGLALMERICRDWLHMDVIPDAKAQTLVPDLVLCGEDALGEILEKEWLAKRPCVVLCANAPVAHQLLALPGVVGRAGVLEFLSQPAGPRKLARALITAFQRWIDMQRLPVMPDADMASSIAPPGPLSAEHLPVPLDQDPQVTPTAETASSLPAVTETENSPASQRPPLVTRSTTSYSMRSPFEEYSDAPEMPLGPSSPSPKPAFLLVDDNNINLKMLSAYMTKLGLPYVTASNGQEAVEIYQEQGDSVRCGCIFMDISMPVMDGFEASRRIRTYEKERQLSPVVIVALSGLASTEAQEEAFRSGINLFLSKPVKLKELSRIMTSRGLL